MQEGKTEKLQSVGALKKQRVLMDDGRRYLIYYTFGENNGTEAESDKKGDLNLPESEARNSIIEEDEIDV